MKGTEVIQTALKGTQFVLNMYLSDLGDADLLVRTSPNANHIAWQLGHLIAGEPMLVRMILPDAKYPALPDGFNEKYGKDGAKNDTGFLSKNAYLELFHSVREATINHVGKLSDADLDKPTTGQMAQFAPNWGAMLVLISNHTLMHAGQITSVRRKQGKPVLF
jgi:hypothetical protein